MDILKQVYQHQLFETEDYNLIARAHHIIKKQKGDILLEKGKIEDEYYIIISGLVRTYVYDYDGNEITTDFKGNHEVVIDVASIFPRVPSQEFIQCLTDCTLYRINYEDFQELFHHIPAMREWGRAWMSYELYLSKKRATEIITDSAAKRYLQLIQEKPHIIQQAPLKYIATYLGITDTSLSRIRKEVAHI